MSAKRLAVMASAFAVALLLPPAIGAQSDPAPATDAPGPAPLAESPAPASAVESPASAPAAEAPAPTPKAETPPIFKAEQLDQLLAPIALYPDPLLAQILMAATYPLEVVKADRWLQDPSHASLRGDQLADAIEAEAWDPSVKSLVPFPPILRMMDEKLDWTEQLGNAVLAQQGDVMDSIQRLRHQAAAAGTLWSNAQQRVTTERQGIVIEPANPEFIYPPVYSPAGVYGPWPYPDYPPFDISPFDISPSDLDFGLPLPFGIGFGAGIVAVGPLWRWCAFDWSQRRIQLDADRFNALNRHGPGIGTSTWQHDPLHRLGVPSGDLVSRAPFQVFRGSAITAAMIPRVNTPSAAAAVPTAVLHSAPPAFASVGRGPTAAWRSAPPASGPVARGLPVRIASPRGLASRQMMMTPMIPGQLRAPIMPRVVARSTTSAPGRGALSGGPSRR
jgi:hypothetical protein